MTPIESQAASEFKFNDEPMTQDDDSDDCSGLMQWFGWIVLLLASFWLVLVVSFLAGYYSVEFDHAASSVLDLIHDIGYAVVSINF